jgi:hypothetical protein
VFSSGLLIKGVPESVPPQASDSHEKEFEGSVCQVTAAWPARAANSSARGSCTLQHSGVRHSLAAERCRQFLPVHPARNKHAIALAITMETIFMAR